MSRRTHAQIVPFAVPIWDDQQPQSAAVAEYLRSEGGDEPDAPADVIGGWRHTTSAERYGQLWVDRLERGGCSVFLVNTHPHSCVGRITLMGFAARREVLEALCADWGLDSAGIQPDRSLMQTV